MLLDSVLEESARRAPDRVAVVCGNSRVTYAELDARANALARVMIGTGVERGDRVGICLDNSVEAVTAFFAVLKAGAVVVSINASTKTEKLAALLDDARARLLVTSSQKLAAVRQAVRCEVLTAPWDGLTADAKPTRPECGAIDQDLACLLYTSGSTGAPKGVMHTHQSLTSVTRSIVSYLGLQRDDVVLSVLPLSFGYGLTQVLTSFFVGATLVLERSFAFPQMTLQRMQNERVTTFAMVPTIATILLQNDLARFDLSSLRVLTNAGAGMAPELLKRLRTQFQDARIFPMYGQTECIRASYLAPELVDERPTSVGRAIPNAELWIVDDDGRRLPAGNTGELVVRGANVMRGYWERPEATAQKLRPGRLPGESVLFTGDLFRVDDDGFFYFVARKDDIIKTRGEKVSPREVENVLYAHEAVLEAAVIGVPDAILGQVVKAYVVPRDPRLLDEKTVLRHCAAHLEDFAVPKRVEFLDALPKTPNEKIDKLALRARE